MHGCARTPLRETPSAVLIASCLFAKTPFPFSLSSPPPSPRVLPCCPVQQLYHASIAALFVKTYSDGSYKDDAASLAARWPLDGSAAAGGDLFRDAEARTNVAWLNQSFLMRELLVGGKMTTKMDEFRQEMAERCVVVGGVHRAVCVCRPMSTYSCKQA